MNVRSGQCENQVILKWVAFQSTLSEREKTVCPGICYFVGSFFYPFSTLMLDRGDKRIKGKGGNVILRLLPAD